MRAWLTLKAFKENRKSRRVYLFALSDHEIMLVHIRTADFFQTFCCFPIFSAIIKITCHTILPSAGGMSRLTETQRLQKMIIFVIYCFSFCLLHFISAAENVFISVILILIFALVYEEKL